MASAGTEESADMGVRAGNIIASDESQRTTQESDVKNRTKTVRGMSGARASSTWTVTLVCVVTAIALHVQIVTAQDPGGTMTVSPVPVLHVVQAGVGQADKPSIASRANQAQPTLGAPHATSAGLIIVPTFDASITNDPNAAAIEATIN